ncbi:thiamine pyrophosphate-dependent enzyme [Gordonia McavH-238-E]|uniref:thiamine pyrophosphate-binding protein n=1 Tax=Gordonia sp. McavH-238-E TaxID=2917736 RepID=UPI001EF5BDE6|nr:thiamine pyrophosphate-binding protein [Gordonia sp. McavH-238-E]MCG7630758.1 thiamine pyrophosphate-dependent enzyme [Gordonia sp. McavH-238-E]
MGHSPAPVGRATVADRVAGRLVDAGVRTAFGVHGANIEDVFDAALKHPRLRPVIAKHEFGAGAMADGHMRLTGEPTAVLTTSGGGALNVVPALGEAYDSRVPVIALIGSAPTPSVGRGGFQDMLDPPDTVDLRAVLSGVTGFCELVDEPSGLDLVLDAAFATMARGLPAAVIVPKDVQCSPWTGADANADRPKDTGTVPAAVVDGLAGRLADVVRDGGTVCIWAGEEASRLEMSVAVDDLAHLLGAAVVVSPGGRDVGRSTCSGVTGVMGHPSAHRAVRDAQLLLVLGCRMSMTDRAGLDDALATIPIVHLGSAPPRTPAAAEHIRTPHLADTVDALRNSLADRVGHRRSPRAHPIDHLPVDPPSRAVGMREVLNTIGDALPERSAVFADAGNTGAAAIHHLPFRDGRFVVALGMGGMGWAIAAGIGSAIALAPDADGRVVVIAGDGSFLMHGMEIHTAIEHDAPVTLIVLNNDAHGMCVTREARFFPDAPSVNRFRHTDIAGGLAAMFAGLPVRSAPDLESLRSACDELLARPGPNCIVVDVDPDETPPFAPLIARGTP